MKNILLILVGGTICTALNQNGTLSVTERSGTALKSGFEGSDSIYADKVNIELTENLFILSENMTVDKWNTVIDTFRKYTKNKKYDGIIFAHGTDTLAYSAALFSMLLASFDTPVFFVSANKRLDSAESNGHHNFRYAVEAICRGISPNVYVIYKNPSDKRTYLHLASRIKQCENYSEDFFSTDAIDLTDINEDNYEQVYKSLSISYPVKNTKRFVDIYGDWHLSNCILLIHPYVGINYASFDYSRFAAVLHTTFHSGTAAVSANNFENSVFCMIESCSEQDISADVFISPSKTEGEIYETVAAIKDYTSKNGKKFNFLNGMTSETAYAKLLIAYSLFNDRNDKKDLIYTEYNFESANN